ncbi:MAG: serine/threonine protein kinase, partial [Myxococcales bacterium]|nr:serine/threonine protein kinase [Myxococcales bacterium]
MEAEPETKVVPAAESAPAGGVAVIRRRIGRYEIIQRLGHGGMATVYLARATGSAGFEKLVAIKVIHPHLAADPELVDMFLDEARIAARIHNPHVVEILDLGHEQGDYFMVMEAVDGETLSALIRKLRPSDGRLPLPVVLQILIDACEGLRAAHELRDADGNLLGLIHRDISPQNLLIDLSGWVKIVDFGIMKAKGRRTDTRTGQLRGKLPYMSPEQAQSRPLTATCDLFALGVILWELLTGQRLFAGENDVETLARVVACERPPLASVRPDLPASLAAILDRALAREPGDRYPTAEAMLGDLRQLLREIDDGGDPRTSLAAIMREHFGDQAEYRRRASARGGSRPRIALVPDADADGGP